MTVKPEILQELIDDVKLTKQQWGKMITVRIQYCRSTDSASIKHINIVIITTFIITTSGILKNTT